MLSLRNQLKRKNTLLTPVKQLLFSVIWTTALLIIFFSCTVVSLIYSFITNYEQSRVSSSDNRVNR
jgi:hypothetical protein